MLRRMATFVKIAESGNISRAARSLGLSVPMASRHLLWLEKELGVGLMRRTTHHLMLTDAGREFLSRARAILSGLDEAREAVRPGRGVVGRVVLAVQPAFGLERIVPQVPALLEKHPRLRLDLRFEDHAVDLIAEGVDVAIRAGPRPKDSSSVVIRRLGSYGLVVVAAPSFLAKFGPVETAADLARAPCIILDTGPREWSFETSKGPMSVVVGGRIHTNDVLATRQLVLAGLGVAWLPSWVAADDLRRRRLKRVLGGAMLPSVDVFALFHKESRGPGNVRAVLDHFSHALEAK
ncbi:MAG: LysR family transcriptional regulator [Myxococcaceae bacterium]